MCLHSAYPLASTGGPLEHRSCSGITTRAFGVFYQTLNTNTPSAPLPCTHPAHLGVPAQDPRLPGGAKRASQCAPLYPGLKSSLPLQGGHSVWLLPRACRTGFSPSHVPPPHLPQEYLRGEGPLQEPVACLFLASFHSIFAAPRLCRSQLSALNQRSWTARSRRQPSGISCRRRQERQGYSDLLP